MVGDLVVWDTPDVVLNITSPKSSAQIFGMLLQTLMPLLVHPFQSPINPLDEEL